MVDTATPRKRLTIAEYLEREEKQEERSELFDGIPETMVGGTRAHSEIKMNILAELHGKLRGRPCRPFGSDFKTQAAADIYYPDVTVDCEKASGDSVLSAAPTIVFQVLSRPTRDKDLRLKLPNYQATLSIQQIVYVESETQALTVWLREGDGWKESELNPGATLQLPSIAAELTFSEIYEDVDFAA